jgi:hypothetical protein
MPFMMTETLLTAVLLDFSSWFCFTTFGSSRTLLILSSVFSPFKRIYASSNWVLEHSMFLGLPWISVSIDITLRKSKYISNTVPDNLTRQIMINNN